MPNSVFMHRCIELALLGQGRVGNGALVGAVLVRREKIIAEGFHSEFGALHAERDLLENFNEEIEPGDVLYVNLEPCCHHGKTPPCTDIILERGIKNIVYGMQDPDPRVSGEGIETLRSAGVNVEGPFLKAECERLNKGFIQIRRLHRPFITLKSARSATGTFSHPDNTPMKITNEEQDRWSHTFLRARHDAILVGVGTVLHDDPQLNIRFDQTYEFSLQIGLNRKKLLKKNFINPLRIILDSHLRIPLASRVVSDKEKARTMVIIQDNPDNDQLSVMRELQERGVTVLPVAMDGDQFDWASLWNVLTTPQGEYHGITSVLVEGGKRTWEMFRTAGIVDEEVVLIGRD